VGLFFEESPASAEDVQAELERALGEEALTDETVRHDEARRRANAVAPRATPVQPKRGAFIGAAALFVMLLGLALLTAWIADGQPDGVEQVRKLSELIQTLITAWSAAVLGLIGGEAVGKKS
jgi:hypothetical protein